MKQSYGPVDLSVVGLYCWTPSVVMAGNKENLYIYDNKEDVGMLILREPLVAGAAGEWGFEVCSPWGWKCDTVDVGLMEQSFIITMLAYYGYRDAVVYERYQKINKLLGV